RHGQIPGELVEAEGEAPPLRTDEIDLHDDGHGPRERLVGAEEDVGDIDPGPGRRPHDHEGHRQAQEPPRHQDRLPSDPRATAARLSSALVKPKVTMNETIAVFDARPTSRWPISGTTARSSPTIAPTKALISTRSENWPRFALRPSRRTPASADGLTRAALG